MPAMLQVSCFFAQNAIHQDYGCYNNRWPSHALSAGLHPMLSYVMYHFDVIRAPGYFKSVFNQLSITIHADEI